jgi:hypothetical protein
VLDDVKETRLKPDSTTVLQDSWRESWRAESAFGACLSIERIR